MTEQLERDLAEVFQIAADRVDVRPPTGPAVRFTRLSTSLAAALTLALIGGVAVAGTRLASRDADKAGVSLSGADAKSILVGALRHTFDEPVRIVTRFRSSEGAAQTSETEMDYAHKTAVMRSNGQVQLLSVNGRVYQRLAAGMADVVKLPAGVQWMEMSIPASVNPTLASATAGGWGSLFGVDPSGLDDPAATARLSVERLSGSQFKLGTTGGGGARTTGLFTVGPRGTVTEAAIQITIDPSVIPGMSGSPVEHQSVDISIEPLVGVLRVTPPAARSVISTERYQRLFRQGISSRPAVCVTSTPSPLRGGMASSSVVCSSSVSSSISVVATPAPSPGHS